jgi:hypothetical protein
VHRIDEALGCTKADVVGGSQHSGPDIAMSAQCTARLRGALNYPQPDVCNTVYGQAKHPVAAGALYVSVGEGVGEDAGGSVKTNGQMDSKLGPLLLVHPNGVSKRYRKQVQAQVR